MSSQSVSIIIPAYNAEKSIVHTLEATLHAASIYRNSYAAQDETPLVEILVVDDGSTDSTKAKVLAFPTVKYLFQENAGPAKARNLGAAEARGTILFFTDSDCRPHEDWIVTMLQHFSKPNVSVVAGSYGIANPEKRLSRCIHQEIIFRHMFLMPEYPSYFGSFNFAVRKEVFFAVGGFNAGYPNASGEDNDLSYRISAKGHKIYFAKDALVDHFHTESVGKYLSEQYRHGFWRARMYKDHPKMTKGDGYTFWKDIVEIGEVLLFYVGAVLVFTGFFYAGVMIGSCALAALAFGNVYFGKKMTGNWSDGFYFSDVMNLRAFSRANGFLAGFYNLLFKKNNTKGAK